MSDRSNPAIALAMTGASGAQYGLRLLECLLSAGEEVALMISQAGRIVINTETSWSLPAQPRAIQVALSERFGAEDGQLQVYGRDQWMAPIASGSSAPQAMVICPCTTATLSSVATGQSNTLIERAADVAIKERRPLILVVRETPFSSIHLENMLTLARVGVTIMPANPAFYHHPQRVEDLVDFMVARILDHLEIEHALGPRWG